MAADVMLPKTLTKKEKQMKTSTTKNEDNRNTATSGTMTLYLALELSWDKWKLAFSHGPAQKPRIRSIKSGDIEALKFEISLAKKRFSLAEDSRVMSCFEAGRDGFWIHRALQSIGVENLVVDSASIEVSRRKRKAKTDRLDAGKLVSMLMRYDAGESKVWAVVVVPSERAEDARHLHRELSKLKKEQTGFVNAIKGILAGQGVRISKIGDGFRQWLGKVRRWDGTSLPKGLGQRVLIEYDRLLLARAQIKAIEKQRRSQLRESQQRDAEVARKLQQLKAIGDNGSWTVSTELLSWRKFSNRKQVGSIAGLTGTPFNSGSSEREQGIDKAGNKRVRGIMVELAWCWLRHQPNSELSAWFQQRFGIGKRLRKIGIVALARRLLIALWRWVDQGVLPAGAELKS